MWLQNWRNGRPAAIWPKWEEKPFSIRYIKRGGRGLSNGRYCPKPHPTCVLLLFPLFFLLSPRLRSPITIGHTVQTADHNTGVLGNNHKIKLRSKLDFSIWNLTLQKSDFILTLAEFSANLGLYKHLKTYRTCLISNTNYLQASWVIKLG